MAWQPTEKEKSLLYLLYRARDCMEDYDDITDRAAVRREITAVLSSVGDDDFWWSYHSDQHAKQQSDDPAILDPGCNPGEGQSRVSDPAGATPAAPLATTLSFRRGEGLQSSWAIIKKGGVTFAEEPISHALCDALLYQQRLLASCLHQCGDVMSRLGWAFAPESGLGLVYNNLLMILAGEPARFNAPILSDEGAQEEEVGN